MSSDGDNNGGENTTGRTIYDLLAEIANRLGVPILVLVGFVFAIYMFQGQYQEGIAQQQAQIDDAHQSLRTTYEAINNMHGTMLDNVTQGMETLQALQDKMKDIEKEADLARQEAMQALETVEEAKADLAKAKRQKEELEQEKKSKQQQIAERLGTFGDDVQQLLDLIADEFDGHYTDIESLAQQIQHTHLIEPAKVLASFKSEGGTEEVLVELQRLEGLSTEKMEALASTNEPGFDMWIRDEEYYVGSIVSEDRQSFKAIAFEEFEGRIYSVETLDEISLFGAPAFSNWDQNMIYAYMMDAGGDHDVIEYEYNGAAEIQLSEMLEFISDSYGFSVISGSDVALSVRPVSELLANEPELVEELSSTYSYVAEMFAMVERSQTFSTSVLVPPAKLDVGLRKTVIQVIDAAVKKDDVGRIQLVPEGGIPWGELAAIALHPTFNLTDRTVTESAATVIFTAEDDYGDLRRAKLAFSRNQSGAWQLDGVIVGYVDEDDQPLSMSLERASIE